MRSWSAMPNCADETLTELQGWPGGERKAQGLRSVFNTSRAAWVGPASRLLFGRLSSASVCGEVARASIQVGLVDTAGGKRTRAGRVADRA